MKKYIISAIALLISLSINVFAQNKIEISSIEANQLLQKEKKLVVLDVRTADEFNSGHIKGAINIDIRQADAYGKIDKLDRKTTYIVHCRTNRRSATAVDYMMEHGFKTVYQIMDGITGWTQNNLPVIK